MISLYYGSIKKEKKKKDYTKRRQRGHSDNFQQLRELLPSSWN